MPCSKNLMFGLLNAGSLGTNHDELIIAINNYQVDIMAINETWLREGEEGRAPAVPGYKLRHIPRPVTIRGGRGGGVAFYTKTGIAARVKIHPENPTVEQMWMSLSVSAKKLLIGTAYRPPWLDIDTFIDAITDSMCALAPYDNVILLGDFNINLLDCNSTKSKKFEDFCNYSGIDQIVTVPTHHIGDSATLIDVICTDAKYRRVNVYDIAELGHHSFVTCELLFKKEKPVPRVFIYRPLKDIVFDNFNKELAAIPWDEIGNLNDVDDMVCCFNSCLLQLFDTHAPMRTTSVKRQPTPWITDNIKLIFRLRDEARCRARRSKNEAHKRYYLDLKHQASTALYSEKKAFFTKYINDNKSDSKALWRNLKKHVLPDIGEGNTYLENFNNPDEINAAFLDIPGDPKVKISNLTYFEFGRYGSATFALKPTDSETIFKIVKNIATNATGIDGISREMIKLTIPQSLSTITNIINKSIKTNKFPSLWRSAIVRPLPKNSCPQSFKDLRPISILPCLSKVLERVVYMQVTDFLESNKILPDLQSGFRAGRGTATALVDVINNIIEARDHGEGTILTLLDFSRAFDSINVSLLLSKLSYYGFECETVKWFASYLTDRLQQVEIRKKDGSSVMSAPKLVPRGIPQGSLLGPILFIIYSADITTSIQDCKYHIYADDTQLYHSFDAKNTSAAVQILNSDLDRIVAWTKTNSLVLNPLKSKFMVMGSKKQITSIISAKPEVRIMGVNIERVEVACNLGLLIDPELRFESYVNGLVKNCFYRLKILYRIRKFLSIPIRKRLVESLVLSKMNYCDVVYGPCLLSRTVNKIQRVQNACARYCFSIPRRNHVTPYLNQYDVLKMAARRRLHLSSLLFGVINTFTPEYLYNKLSWRQDHYAYSARSASRPLSVPKYKTTAFRGCFKYAATHCWNDIPPPIRSLKTKISFKSNLKKYLLEKQKS